MNEPHTSTRQASATHSKNAPEQVPDRFGDRFGGFVRLCRSKPNQLRPRKGKGSRHKHVPKALEAIVEGRGAREARIPNGVDVLVAGNVDDDAQNRKAHDGRDLEHRCHEFGLAVRTNAQQVDSKHADEEDGNADRVWNGEVAPIFESLDSRQVFQRNNDEPLQGVVPAHGKAPCRVNESGAVRGEGSCYWKDDGLCCFVKNKNEYLKYKVSNKMSNV